MAHGLEAIDWLAPWLAPWRAVGERVATHAHYGNSVARALNAHNDVSPKIFVPQADLPANTAYEQFIFETNKVPTRDGLHDFFNGLAWLHFPATKIRLNALQAAQIARTGIAPQRGPARDALTVFDENAAFLQASDDLWQALAAKDWLRLFVDLRPLWEEAQLIVFGHALLEKLVTPRKAMTAHVYRVRTTDRGLQAIDAWMASDLNADTLAAKPFAHLPVLGVPHWWPANMDSQFYADTAVFRPPRALPDSAPAP